MFIFNVHWQINKQKFIRRIKLIVLRWSYNIMTSNGKNIMEMPNKKFSLLSFFWRMLISSILNQSLTSKRSCTHLSIFIQYLFTMQSTSKLTVPGLEFFIPHSARNTFESHTMDMVVIKHGSTQNSTLDCHFCWFSI